MTETTALPISEEITSGNQLGEALYKEFKHRPGMVETVKGTIHESNGREVEIELDIVSPRHFSPDDEESEKLARSLDIGMDDGIILMSYGSPDERKHILITAKQTDGKEHKNIREETGAESFQQKVCRVDRERTRVQEIIADVWESRKLHIRSTALTSHDEHRPYLLSNPAPAMQRVYEAMVEYNKKHISSFFDIAHAFPDVLDHRTSISKDGVVSAYYYISSPQIDDARLREVENRVGINDTSAVLIVIKQKPNSEEPEAQFAYYIRGEQKKNPRDLKRQYDAPRSISNLPDSEFETLVSSVDSLKVSLAKYKGEREIIRYEPKETFDLASGSYGLTHHGTTVGDAIELAKYLRRLEDQQAKAVARRLTSQGAGL